MMQEPTRRESREGRRPERHAAGGRTSDTHGGFCRGISVGTHTENMGRKEGGPGPMREGAGMRPFDFPQAMLARMDRERFVQRRPHHRHDGVRVAPPNRRAEPGRAPHGRRGQCPLPAVPVGPGLGTPTAHRTAVPAALFAEPEPDRTAMAIREDHGLERTPARIVHHVLRRHRSMPQRMARAAPDPHRDPDGPRISNMRTRFKAGRVRYKRDFHALFVT